MAISQENNNNPNSKPNNNKPNNKTNTKEHREEVRREQREQQDLSLNLGIGNNTARDARIEEARRRADDYAALDLTVDLTGADESLANPNKPLETNQNNGNKPATNDDSLVDVNNGHKPNDTTTPADSGQPEPLFVEQGQESTAASDTAQQDNQATTTTTTTTEHQEHPQDSIVVDFNGESSQVTSESTLGETTEAKTNTKGLRELEKQIKNEQTEDQRNHYLKELKKKLQEVGLRPEVWEKLSNKSKNAIDNGATVIFIKNGMEIGKLNRNFGYGSYVAILDQVGNEEISMKLSTRARMIIEGLDSQSKPTITIKGDIASCTIEAIRVKTKYQGTPPDKKSGKEAECINARGAKIINASSLKYIDATRGAEIEGGCIDGQFIGLIEKINKMNFVSRHSQKLLGMFGMGLMPQILQKLDGFRYDKSLKIYPDETHRYPRIKDKFTEKYSSKGKALEEDQRIILELLDDDNIKSITDFITKLDDMENIDDTIKKTIKQKIYVLDRDVQDEFTEEILEGLKPFSSSVPPIPESQNIDDVVSSFNKEDEQCSVKEINKEDLEKFDINVKKFLKNASKEDLHVYLIVDKDTGRRALFTSNIDGTLNVAMLVEHANPKGDKFAIYSELGDPKYQALTNIDASQEDIKTAVEDLGDKFKLVGKRGNPRKIEASQLMAEFLNNLRNIEKAKSIGLTNKSSSKGQETKEEKKTKTKEEDNAAVSQADE